MSEPLLPTDPPSIGGHRLLARLGAGGMGVVYLGRTAAGALAAVKVVQADLADEPDFRTRFRREVEAARRVDSPWAAPVTAAGPDAPTPWLATAFVPGPSLGEAVARLGPLPPRSVRALGRMLAEALREVHAAGLVHRDVKPANVLLAVDGPRLIDFGIARSLDATALTSAGMVVGTPGFLSPEQAEAHSAQLGPPSDVFSLGCLLAYAATGRPPFGTGTVEAMLYRTVHDEPDLDGIDGATASTGSVNTDSDSGSGNSESQLSAPDAELLALLRACLAKDPQDRPTAAELADRLATDAPPADDWLPQPVVRDIAARAADMLALPDIEPTAGGTSAAGTEDAADGPSSDTDQLPPRRRLLFLASGAGLLAAAGGGAALWAVNRDDGDASNAPSTQGPRPILAVHADLSGSGREVGRAQEQGARLAVEQFNSRRDKPFELRLRTEDDRGEVERSKSAARQLADDREVFAVLGPTSDDVAAEVLDTYDEALLPLLLVAPGGMVLGSKECRSLLHCRAGDAAVSYPLAVYIAQQKDARSPGLLQDRTASSYSWECAQITTLMLRQFGIPPRPRVVPAGTTDLRPVVADILRQDVGAFVYAGLADGAARVARALDAAGFRGPRLAPQAVLDPEFVRQAGTAAEGWLIAASFVDPAAVPSAKQFTAAFRRRFGTAPGHFAAESYDSANLAIRELVRATRNGRPPTRSRLVDQLRKSRYEGVAKTYAFKPEDGRLAGPGSFLYRVENGEFRFLGAAPTGE